MDNVRPPESSLEAEVPVTEGERSHIAGPAARKPVAQGANVLDRKVERVEVERVRAGREHANVKAIGEQLPGSQLPRVRGVPAQDDDARPPHLRRNAWLSSGGIACSASDTPTKTTRATGSVTSHDTGSATIANAGSAATTMRGVSPGLGATTGAS